MSKSKYGGEAAFNPFKGIPSFCRAPLRTIEEAEKDTIVVFGCTHDTGSRQGAKHGAKLIREASEHFAYYFQTSTQGTLVDTRTNQIMKYKGAGTMYDAGDIPVYPNDVPRTGESIATAVETLMLKGAYPVMLGGDHYTTFPAVKGFLNALRKTKPDAKIGLIHFDAHLDLGDDNPIIGKLNNATTVRRIAELDGVSPENICSIGPRGWVRQEQWEYIKDTGLNCYTTHKIRQMGYENVIREASERASNGVDAVYLTVDIDAVDATFAPGNSGIAFDGLTSQELLVGMELLSTNEKIRGFDFVEVNGHFDPSEITPKLAATATLTFLKPRLFDLSPG